MFLAKKKRRKRAIEYGDQRGAAQAWEWEMVLAPRKKRRKRMERLG